MLKILDTRLVGQTWINAVALAMRNPMNSWDKSDSADILVDSDHGEFGPVDLELAKMLVKEGPSDRKFMRMIPVMVTLNAPIYWWKEMDTYKVGVTRSSCSTMHKLMAKPFEIDDFSFHLDNNTSQPVTEAAFATVRLLNWLRKQYLEEKDPNEKRKYWYETVRLLPEAYNQTATLTLDYEVLSNIYSQRKNHKLSEWHIFCKWIKSLPQSELITKEDI